MKSRIGALVIVAAAVAVWLVVGPASLGGGATYVSTHGISMEPAFKAGDLAVVRAARNYAVGDVATYRSEELNTLVMHRIVAVDGDRYTLQGDNNSWVDSEQPTLDRLHGKLAFRVPQGGVWLGRATSPAALGLIAFILFTSGGTTATITRRRRRKKGQTMTSKALPLAALHLPPDLRGAAVVAAALAVCSVALVVMTWSGPPVAAAGTVVDEAPGPTVTFSYRTTAPESPAYDSTNVTAPQPIFRKVVDDVEVLFTYDSTTEVSATVQVTAELSTANGWHSSLPLGPPTGFTGERYRGNVDLVLSRLQARADAAAAAIGDASAGDVTVKIVPEITTQDGAKSLPGLTLTLSPIALRLAGDETSLIVGSAPPSLAPVSRVPPSVSVLGQPVPATLARTASAGALLLAIAAALLLAAAARRPGDAAEGSAIQARYAQALLTVDPMVLPAGRRVVDVPQIAALVRLAERYGLFVMHWHRGDLHTYVVLDDSATYRYRHGSTSTAERAPSGAIVGV